MGILYLDEAGNTGLWDSTQSHLIYGGPYVRSSEWKGLNTDIEQIRWKYKTLIISRFRSGISSTTSLQSLNDGVGFLNKFRLHATDIAGRRELWVKLSDVEKFNLIDEVLDALLHHKVPFYVGTINKAPLQTLPRVNDMREFNQLLPRFFSFFEQNLICVEDYTVIIDDGNINEKDCVRNALRNSSFKKSMGDLIIDKSSSYCLLDVADIGVWIVQSFMRLPTHRTDSYALNVRNLYSKLSTVLKRLDV